MDCDECDCKYNTMHIVVRDAEYDVIHCDISTTYISHCVTSYTTVYSIMIRILSLISHCHVTLCGIQCDTLCGTQCETLWYKYNVIVQHVSHPIYMYNVIHCDTM